MKAQFDPAPINFGKTVNIPISLGHAFFVWEILNTHFDSLDTFNLTHNEKKAIWGLSDLIEQTLIQEDMSEYDHAHYADLLKKAEHHLQHHVLVDFVDWLNH